MEAEEQKKAEGAKEKKMCSAVIIRHRFVWSCIAGACALSFPLTGTLSRNRVVNCAIPTAILVANATSR